MSTLKKILGNHKLGFIGAGNMCEALVRGLVASGLVSTDQVIVSDPSQDRHDLFKKMGCVATFDNNEVIDASSVLVLAVKPQVAEKVLSSLRSRDTSASKLFISIMAGKQLDWMKSHLQQLGGGTRVIRVMPNTPLMVLAGATGILADAQAREEDVVACKEFFSLVGEVEVVQDEDLINSVTAVSGSGPAYIFHLIEGMVEGGKRAGFTEEQAMKLAIQTVVGSGKLAKEQYAKGVGPAQLRQMVTSPGGTTAAALKVMADNNFLPTVSDAVVAAHLRSRELGKL